MRNLIFSKTIILIAFHKPFETETEEGRSLERQRRISLNALTSAILRIFSMAIPLLTLNFTFNYLNAEVYGLWSAITTFFALFIFSDLGLGNGLQTRLSQAYGRGDIDLCNKIISNTFTILLFISFILLSVFIISFPLIDWSSLMNAQNTESASLAPKVVFIIFIPQLLSIPVAIIQRTQLALQEGYKSDIWGILGYIANLFFIISIVKFDLGKVTLLLVYSVLPLLVSATNMIVYFRHHRKDMTLSIKLFDIKTAKSLLSLGVFFSLLSILTTIGLSMDTFIVARTCSLAEAGAYSVIYRVATIFSIVVTIFATPLWGANGEAIARGDINWVIKNTKKISFFMSSTSLVLVFFGLSFSNWIFHIWLGDEFHYSFPALIWLSIMQILLSFISPYFMVLNASGKVKIQILLFCIFTPITFLLKYYLSSIFGVWVVPMVGTITYFLVIVVGIYFFSNKHLKELKVQN